MFNIEDLTEATGGKLIDFVPREIEGFSIDTRNLTEGEFFIPLPGSRTDGHKFLEEAFEKGASGAFIRSRDYVEPEFFNLVIVDDTEAALLNAAKRYRSRFDVPVAGVTGSWGKTTTKELIASILSKSGKVHKSPGNYNTEYGLPLSLLEMKRDVDYGVFELGLQYPGDVGRLSEVLSPTIGLITGVGKVHAEHFQSIREIAEEKLKLTKGMEPCSKILINGDSETLLAGAKDVPDYEFIEYGAKETEKKYTARDIMIRGTDGVAFQLNSGRNRPALDDKLGDLNFRLESGLNSRANVSNIVGASALALEMGISSTDVKKGVNINPLPQRLDPIEFSGGKVIDDTYNANPAATINALEFIGEIESAERKFFVFGDMKELGKNALDDHKELASYIKEAGINYLLAIGELTEALVKDLDVKSTQAEWFESRDGLKRRLNKLIGKYDNLVLVKGSRSMEMEYFVSFLTEGKNNRS
ncbi:UDP-N-acetylmuramoyl-tripeptide--D-alanyl-D-alanine ligase [Candidatus Bipolaricaulota bacterium]|nr:UDP-N-acetylmuramoyl-tripeptide--D-alanyl-D-alanine ligase [Candidatus Bipolaricaulota bacterium]